MTYTVEFAPAAKRQLRKLPLKTKRRIIKCVEGLEKYPRPPGARKLADSDNLYRIRTGNYRIIYQVEDEILFVLVIKIGDRKDVYKSLLR
ncbi:MAG: type II toxin-antitoxin system RelE/ParE family toxin [Thermoanaerobaculia bacterium]